MKKIKFNIISFFSIVLLFSCSQDEIITTDEVANNTLNFENESKQSIEETKYYFQYYDVTFQINIVANEESDEILEVTGDLEIANEFFENFEDVTQAIEYKMVKDDDNAIIVKLYDTQEEILPSIEEIESLMRERNNSSHENKNFGCINAQNSGTTNTTRFYKHVNSVSEMVGLRRNNHNIFFTPHFGIYNDQLSSLYSSSLSGDLRSIYLYEDSCFSGRVQLFTNDQSGIFGGSIISKETMRITNLKRFTRALRWCGLLHSHSWNDEVSSAIGINWIN